MSQIETLILMFNVRGLTDFTEWLQWAENLWVKRVKGKFEKKKFSKNQSKMSEAFLVRYPWLQKRRVENPEASYEQANHCEESQHQSGFEDGCSGFLINKSKLSENKQKS